MMTVDTRLCRALQFAALPVALIVCLTIASPQRCVAQTQASAQTWRGCMIPIQTKRFALETKRTMRLERRPQPPRPGNIGLRSMI